jgi:hypothetical protein
MMSGMACAANPAAWQSHPEALTRAAVALVPRLGFVGLVDRWDDSIFLFHAMFDLGPPLAVEMLDTHPGTAHRAGAYDVAPLEGFVDASDARVYREARRVFELRLALFARKIAAYRDAFAKAAAHVKKNAPAETRSQHRPESMYYCMGNYADLASGRRGK